MLKSIIVDDEFKSRESLKALIEKFCENVGVSALCENGQEAIKAIEEIKPDVVFLDIQFASFSLAMGRIRPYSNEHPDLVAELQYLDILGQRPEKMKLAKDAGLAAWVKKPYRAENFLNKFKKL
jgi:DNA-binding LytR/AlgR family response regulator